MVTTQSETDILARCDRFLNGHGPLNPRETLVALAEDVTPDERSDHYGSGAIIEDFEREVAQILGHESAVFVPSGTMAQQIALRIWSDRNGSRTVAFHPTCHLEMQEQKGYAHLHGLQGKLIGGTHRLITLADLEAMAEPVAALLLELPQREIGGQLPSWEDLVSQTDWAREHGIVTHLDGARLWEAGPFYDRPYAEIAALFDSVYVSFYKGIGALAGAVLAGPDSFIAEARVWIRRHGGNLIQLYPYVISARSNLRARLPRFPAYYARTLAIAETLRSIPGIEVKPDPPQSCMMHIYLRGDRDTLEAARTRIAADHGLLLFRSLSPAEVPGYWVFELSIGDAAEAISDEELAQHFREIATDAG